MISATVNSATARALRPGALHTTTPCRLAASRFTFTAPLRAHAASRSSGAAASTSAPRAAMCTAATCASRSTALTRPESPVYSRISASWAIGVSGHSCFVGDEAQLTGAAAGGVLDGAPQEGGAYEPVADHRDRGGSHPSRYLVRG